jgi:hypothetical protein
LAGVLFIYHDILLLAIAWQVAFYSPLFARGQKVAKNALRVHF